MTKRYHEEVLIYVQKSLKFFRGNEEAREYFCLTISGSMERYGAILTEVAQENFDKTGDPSININQFEAIREKMCIFVSEYKKQMFEKAMQTESFFSTEYVKANILNTISLN